MGSVLTLPHLGSHTAQQGRRQEREEEQLRSPWRQPPGCRESTGIYDTAAASQSSVVSNASQKLQPMEQTVQPPREGGEVGGW